MRDFRLHHSSESGGPSQQPDDRSQAKSFPLPDGPAEPEYVTTATYEYDQFNRLVKVTDGPGRVSEWK